MEKGTMIIVRRVLAPERWIVGLFENGRKVAEFETRDFTIAPPFGRPCRYETKTLVGEIDFYAKEGYEFVVIDKMRFYKPPPEYEYVIFECREVSRAAEHELIMLDLSEEEGA
jgi:hypothetical protein